MLNSCQARYSLQSPDCVDQDAEASNQHLDSSDHPLGHATCAENAAEDETAVDLIELMANQLGGSEYSLWIFYPLQSTIEHGTTISIVSQVK